MPASGWADQYFRLDLVLSPRPVSLLEVDVGEERSDVVLPPFIEVIDEVTDNPEYRMAEFASVA